LIVQAVFTHRRNLSPRVRVLLEFLMIYCAKILV
jgi:LysR family transcriptional regulator, regulator for bpeEF and oprC